MDGQGRGLYTSKQIGQGDLVQEETALLCSPAAAKLSEVLTLRGGSS